MANFLDYIGDAFQSIFGGNSGRRDSNNYTIEQMNHQQLLNERNMKLQQGYNERNMSLQYGVDLGLMKHQFDYNKQAFDLENAYNTPTAQRERMAQAGLNPNWSDQSAIAQMDAVSPVSAPSGGMPSGGSPSGGSVSSQLAGGLSDVVNLLAIGSQIDKNKADANQANSNAHKLDTEANNNEFRLDSDKKWLDTERLAGTSLQQAMQHYHENKALLDDKELEYFDWYKQSIIANIEASTDKTKEEKKVLVDTLPSILAQYAANTKKALSESRKADVEANYIPYEAYTKRMDAFSKRMDAETNRFLSASQSAVNNALSGKYSVETSIGMIEKELKNIMLDTEQYASESGLRKYEVYYGAKKMKKEYYKVCAEIAQIMTSRDKDKALKYYLINNAIKGWIDSASQIFEPFMPGAGLRHLNSLKDIF